MGWSIVHYGYLGLASLTNSQLTHAKSEFYESKCVGIVFKMEEVGTITWA